MGRNFEESVFKYYYLGYGPFKLYFESDFSKRSKTENFTQSTDPNFSRFDEKYNEFTKDSKYDDVGFIGKFFIIITYIKPN